MSNLRFHVPGIPLTADPYETISGLTRIKQLGLDGMELEWVHQVPFDTEKAKKVRKTIEKLDLSLTVHGSYYVNLASEEKRKYYASINRIVKAARIGSICGAQKVTFHPAFYMNHSKEKVFDMVRGALEKIKERLAKDSINIKIAPELTGKPTQFGDLQELIDLATQVDIDFCLDFSHLHARTNGAFNTVPEFESIFKSVKKHLGGDYLKDMYFHLSGILYSEKGERRHLCFLEDITQYKKERLGIDSLEELDLKEKTLIKGGPDIKWKELLQVIKKYEVGGHLVVESPCMELDTLLLKRYYENLG